MRTHYYVAASLDGFLATEDDSVAWLDTQPTWVFTHRALPAIPGADVRFVSGDVRPVHEAIQAVERRYRVPEPTP